MRGILYVVAASILFGLTPSANKFVILSGLTPDCTLFYQLTVMVIGCFILAKVQHQSLRVSRSEAVRLVLVGILGMGVTCHLINSAYVYLPVGTAVMLHFMYPTIVLLIMVILFHQKLSMFSIGAVAMSILGLFLVSGSAGGINLKGAAYALGSGVAYAVFTVSNEKAGIEKLPLFVRLFYLSLSALVVVAAVTFAGGSFAVPADGVTALVLFGGVGIGSLLAFYAFTAGIQLIGAEQVAFINLMEPVVGVVTGVLFYHEILTARSVLGSVCILASIFLIAMDGAQAAKQRALAEKQRQAGQTAAQ